jgi:hypothetical protein
MKRQNEKQESENDFVRLLFSLFPFLFLVLPYARLPVGRPVHLLPNEYGKLVRAGTANF